MWLCIRGCRVRKSGCDGGEDVLFRRRSRLRRVEQVGYSERARWPVSRSKIGRHRREFSRLAALGWEIDVPNNDCKGIMRHLRRTWVSSSI